MTNDEEANVPVTEVPPLADDMSESDRQAAALVNEKPDEDKPGQSIEDMAENGAEIGEEDDGQLFVMEQERRVTLGSLIKRGTPVEYEFKLGGKGIKGGTGMGLLSFTDPDILLIVPARAGKVEVEPTFNPDGTVKKVVIRAHVKPITCYDARTEAGRVALNGE